MINYHYDFQGFKIIQTINRNDSVFKQHYVRDPQGSVLAIYTDTSATNYKKLTLSELSIYGSSRLGTIQLDSVLYKQNGNNIVTPTISNVYAQKLGLKRYELSNHLGNVTTVVSDRKFIQGNGQNAVFVADIVSVTDYYAYGMKISERTWGKDARYQYNGKEQDKGFGRYNFDGRMYDERSCRWMSLDPKAGKYAGISPYVGFANNPIFYTDPGGDTLKIALRNQSYFIEDVEKVLGFSFNTIFEFDDIGRLKLTKSGEIISFKEQTMKSFKGKVFEGLLKVMNSEEITNITYVEPNTEIKNPETAKFRLDGDVPFTNANGTEYNANVENYGGEMTVTLRDSRKNKLINQKENHIFILKDEIHNPGSHNDPRSNNTFHGIGHIIYQRSDEQEKVIEYDNFARAASGVKLRPMPKAASVVAGMAFDEVDKSHINRPETE